jgi:cytosine/adenosine deaminase-related metal-dependent hydrolase
MKRALSKQNRQTHQRPHAFERNIQILPWWDGEILRLVAEHGGFYNAHGHFDRAHTLQDHFLRHIGTTPLEASSLPLAVKQNLVGDLHLGVGYTEDNLRERMSHAIEMQIAFGVTRIDTNIDATPDLPEDGLLAIRVALELKEKYSDRVKIRIAPTPIFGFKEGTRRWEVFVEAARRCDYLSLLPEKDDYDETRPSKKDGRVGFKRHIRMGVELACELSKEVQFHLDQMNIPGERGTERLLETLEVIDQPLAEEGSGQPMVWVIHMISPSAYSEERFARLVDKLLQYNVGIIVCPSAALSMRQLRSLDGPIHNSIARVLELIKRKVPIRLGTDNIADVFVPASDGDMLTEIKMGAQATRVYNPSIWAKLASGSPLNNVDINMVGRVLHEDRKACWAHNSDWQPAVE